MVFVKTAIRSALTAGTAVIALATSALGASLPAQASSANIWSPATTPLCFATTATYAPLAAQLAKDIPAAMHGRAGNISVRVEDSKRGVECQVNADRHYYSASVVKVTILGALLYWRQRTNTSLTTKEKSEATLMIEQSDNAAASYLWGDVGHTRLQQFVTAANMTETVLDSGGSWGLTQITARDEARLLHLLTEHGTVLTDANRGYELNLMKNVEASQRWGTPAGAPSKLTVEVKNGWLNYPNPSLWIINSLGAFSGYGRDYKMAILTNNSPESYGIATVEGIARVVNRDLNAGLSSAGSPLPGVIVPQIQLGQPDEVLPKGAH
jgi:beta-lactamase class A